MPRTRGDLNRIIQVLLVQVVYKYMKNPHYEKISGQPRKQLAVTQISILYYILLYYIFSTYCYLNYNNQQNAFWHSIYTTFSYL